MGNKTPKTQSAAPREPLLLALESATGVSSVAVFAGSKLLGVTDYHQEKLHSRLLTVMVDRLLADLSIAPAELAAVGVASGPGSYTGLRVGVSTAKGLCMALDKPLLSVGSLAALAQTVTDLAQALDAVIVPMIDARRMEVFCGVFDALGQSIAPVIAKVVEADAFAEWLDRGKVIFLGDGAAKCAPLLHHPHAVLLGKRFSTAAGMGPGLWQKFQSQEFEDLITFEPFYLKNFVATKPKNKIL
ncbi:MAG: tRNA (adenosine(37)-N6)-threonylcarbamoyltransferase complex dimerization subunit type 1 TsaB [Bacteroidota bacterium]